MIDMKTEFKKLCIGTLLLFSTSAQSLFAQEQLALLIGINKYEPPPGVKVSDSRPDFQDLKGPVHDLEEINNLIQTKYRFPKSNISILLNEKASRQNILASFESLLYKSKKGDIVFIYYAGHGSRVNNSLSAEDDKIDESIVPADVWKPGVQDIRDKTLAAVFNKFVDKGVILTCIFDCCHSGSIGRGYQSSPPRFRFMSSPNYDIKDASNPPRPESKPNSNFLILSACQDQDLAAEFDASTGTYGIFTYALLQALYQQSTDAPVHTLFSAASAIIATRIKQPPAMDGDEARMRGTLFGLPKGSVPNKNLVAVIVDTLNTIRIQGGFLMGLNPENELTSVNGKVKIKVTKVNGPSNAEGEIITGKLSDLESNGLFEVTNWVSSSQPQLKIFIPDSKLSTTEILKYAGIVSKVNNLVTDFERSDPVISVYYEKNKWWYNDPVKGKVGVADFSTEGLNTLSNGKAINVNIPATTAMRDFLKTKYADLRNVMLVNDASEAQYVLYGIPENERVAYCLVQVQVSAADSLGIMPQQTKAMEWKGDKDEDYAFVADSIYEYSLRLAKISSWITVQTPKLKSFPAHLELADSATNKRIDNKPGGLKLGDKFLLNLVLEDGFDTSYDQDYKYVYAFLIDRSGAIKLLYPTAKSASDNKFPKTNDDNTYQKAVRLRKLKATLPVGTDNYFLLITSEPIPDYTVTMNQQGVRGINARDAYGKLLDIGNETQVSSPPNIMQTNWSLQRLSVKTHH